jgi:hypothetical protein
MLASRILCQCHCGHSHHQCAKQSIPTLNDPQFQSPAILSLQINHLFKINTRQKTDAALHWMQTSSHLFIKIVKIYISTTCVQNFYRHRYLFSWFGLKQENSAVLTSTQSSTKF